MASRDWSSLSAEELRNEIRFDEAIRLRDVEGVEAFFAHTKVDPNFRMRGREPRLHQAAAGGSVELCRLLVGAGALLDARDDSEGTALIAAAGSEHFEVCKFLIGAGADVHAVDVNGQAALHRAALQNQGTTCALLVAHGAGIEHVDLDRKTALHVAAEEGSASSCEVLISHGANIYALDNLNETPLHNACWRDALDVCELFVGAGFDLNFVPENFEETYLTVTQRAVKQDSFESTAYFLTKCGQDPNQVTLGGAALADLPNKTTTRDLVRSIATEQEIARSLDGSVQAAPSRQSMSPL